MKKILLCCSAALLLYSCFTERKNAESKKDKYDNAWAREFQEAERIKDPALGYVPYQRLYEAINQTEALKIANRTYIPLTWVERGPIYDSVGPSNGK
jgi:hypothetical protein